MAITKKHQEIRAQKEQVRALLLDQYKLAMDAATKVPAFVRQGSHTISVRWREIAESVLGWHESGPADASLWELEQLVSVRCNVVAMLTGEKPINLDGGNV